jgi:hypothetical protein
VKRCLSILGAGLLAWNGSWSLSGAAPATNGPPPVISGFSPTQGEVGTSVEIKGTNLTSATSVQFNGLEASFRILSGLLFATVPTNATTGPITVKTPDGTNSTTEAFTIVAFPPPVIASFSPIEGKPGTDVEIKGTNLTSVSTVKFNGVDATFNLLAGLLVASVPSGASTGPITVITQGGAHTTTNSFTVLQRSAPIISGFSPVQGGPGTSVEIQGTNLVDVTAVQFNGVAASFLSTGESLRASVPTAATSGPITVITPSGTNTTTAIFTVTAGPTPVINSFSPTGGEPGIAVEILGTFLRDVTAVKFNGADAIFTNSLFRPLSAIVPIAATTGPITVITRGGTATTTNAFIVTNVFAPVIESFSPMSGTPGTIFSVYGTNLTGVTRVDFKGVQTSFVEFNSERLFVFVPTNAPSGPITVLTVKGITTSKESFSVSGAPPQEPPMLSIRTTAQTDIELSWPSDAEGFVLQSTDSVGPSAIWSNEAMSGPVIEGRLVVTRSTAVGQRFYRLIRP